MDLQAWLNLVCQTLPKVSGAVLVTQADERTAPSAQWPEDTHQNAELLSAVPLAAKRRSPVFSRQQRDGASHLLVAHPLLIEQQLFAVLVVEMQASANQQKAITQMLSWAQTWLELLVHQNRQSTERSDQLWYGMIQEVSTQAHFEDSLRNLATQWAQAFQAERVSIGLVQSGKMVLQAVSGSALFDRRHELARALQTLMEEVRQQGTASSSNQPTSSTALQQLQQVGQLPAIIALPLTHPSGNLGALVIESTQSCSATEQQQLTELCSGLAELVALKKQSSKSERGVTHWWTQWHSQPKGRIAGALVLLLGLALTFGQMPYRVSAQASIEGRIQRAVVAPFDGYVAQSQARAGELVTEGQLIAALDDREILLEQRRWASQRDEFNKQYRQALAELDSVQAKIYQAQARQAEAQLALLKEQNERARLIAPITGLIINGDLSRSLGAPVERGQVLYEIAPLDEYRLVLMVDERDIQALAVGQQGQLALSALPGEDFSFALERVATQHEDKEQRVLFRSEASLAQTSERLRPGMQGIAKVEIGPRSIGWVLFHRLLHWLRAQWWTWTP